MNARPLLDKVTLVAATSVAIRPTIAAMRRTMQELQFASAKLFTDQPCPQLDTSVERIAIAPLRSRAAYSEFMLRQLVDHIDTDQVMVVQWDGFVLDGSRWNERFLSFDFIGAPWPQFADGHDVGNGGFSMRSRRLMEAIKQMPVPGDEPEDVAIGRILRPALEARGFRFADRDVAALFSFERTRRTGAELGFHGAFNLPGLVPRDELHEILAQLEPGMIARRDLRPMALRCMARTDITSMLRLFRQHRR